MGFAVCFTQQARDDLARLYEWLLKRTESDFTIAECVSQAIRDGVTVLELAPLSCRKAVPADPFLRELVIGFGASGCVVLFEVESNQVVTVLAVRHQREDDYH
ncbi:type II toxin-antitoxin system RelE/ParE family toxin [Xanthomonas campestris]|uniref:type II toxin-antitoxin system RelE/ParE family toxin n=1 Tax=Xanthomonas campestris TaxID=339 RepID=UPI001E56A37E|nr:type II toxin-antitoxin system RelE/ParE family toxin [Xanthomonas campestris]MCC5049620.1 type II toxin-antitoxin system RelE/ParE family toxin [Xanthomonas campestris]MCC5057912.1 type II toxin-antitoxin system RelE/ParE family toxin [Xanthomonas campestris]MCC5062029.1 type II toxin-antitoxin system RelE/ParE family toxin [Xanthomonas campestris]